MDNNLFRELKGNLRKAVKFSNAAMIHEKREAEKLMGPNRKRRNAARGQRRLAD